MGRLGQDPETKYTAAGLAITTLSVATSEKWKDKNGEKHEKTEWHRCTLFGKTAEVAGEYLKKGQLVDLMGRLQTDKYEKDGQTHYATKIIVDKLTLMPNGGPRTENEDSEPAARSAPTARTAPTKPAANTQGDLDDDIPF